MTIAVDLGRKVTKQTNKQTNTSFHSAFKYMLITGILQVLIKIVEEDSTIVHIEDIT